jgi:four helix bundle protein
MLRFTILLMIQSHKDLIVWQKSMDLVVAVYKLTGFFPKEEIYGLTAQMKKCAVSIPSNISEGRKRGTSKDYRHFLLISFGSASELETQIEIAQRLGFGRKEQYVEVESFLEEVLKMLAKMTKTLNPITYHLQPTTL